MNQPQGGFVPQPQPGRGPAVPQGWRPQPQQQAPQGAPPAGGFQRGFQQPQGQGLNPFAQAPGVRGQGQPRAIIANPYAGVNKAINDRNDERIGTYLEQIISAEQREGQNSNLPYVLIKKLILAVGHPGDGSVNPHSPGEEVQHFINFSIKWSQYFIKDCNHFVSTMVPCHPTEVTEEQCVAAFGPTQPFAGLLVLATNTWRPDKRNPQNPPRVQHHYDRRVFAHEVVEFLPPDALARFFPGDALQKLAEREQRVMAMAQQNAAPAVPQFGQQQPMLTQGGPPPVPGAAPSPFVKQMQQPSGQCGTCAWVGAHQPGCPEADGEIPF